MTITKISLNIFIPNPIYRAVMNDKKSDDTKNLIGILDPLGEHDNPLTNLPYSTTYREIAKIWSGYPAYVDATKTIDVIRDNNVIMIVSGTGSGKTVLIPKFALHAFEYKKKIAVVLPKQILTKSAATFAALTLDVELGAEVGYKHRGEKIYDRTKTKLLYTTDGTLVSMLTNDPMLPEFDAVIIDEAHERRTQTDFLLYMLKQTCKARPDFKLIIMSATIDTQIFSDYFKSMKFIIKNISGEPNHPIDHVYVPDKINRTNYIARGLELINKILTETKTGDILFFVPSIAETFMGCKQLTNDTNFCVEVYGGMDADRELLATNRNLYQTRYMGKTRKIVIATNVAESSLTIDGIEYVVDSGYEFIGYFDPSIESMVLDKRLTTRAQIKQRCGRTGRTAPGTCYHMYTQDEYDKLPEFPKPSIQTSDITTECLALLVWVEGMNINRLIDILTEFIEPPTQPYIEYMVRTLTRLNLVENDTLTDLGKLVSSLSVDPMQGVAICSGWLLGCYRDVVAIIVIGDAIKNDTNKLFNFNRNEKDKQKIKQFNAAKSSLMKKNSDHYTLLTIYRRYRKLKKKSPDDLEAWINRHYLKKKILDTIDTYCMKMRKDCVGKLKKYFGSSVPPTTNRLRTRVLASLLKGYRLHTAVLTESGYSHGRMTEGRPSNDSWLSGKQKQKLMYSQLFTTNGRTFLQINTHVTKKMRTLSNSIDLNRPNVTSVSSE